MCLVLNNTLSLDGQNKTCSLTVGSNTRIYNMALIRDKSRPVEREYVNTMKIDVCFTKLDYISLRKMTSIVDFKVNASNSLVDLTTNVQLLCRQVYNLVSSLSFLDFHS